MNDFIFGLGIALSQFYIFSSGVPQPAHYLLLLAMISSSFRFPTFLFSKDRATFSLRALIFYACSINLIFATIYQSFDFLLSSLYLIFGILIFYQTKTTLSKNERAEGTLLYWAFFGLVALFLLAIFDIGEYRFTLRYNAFFNDPNQMAFWALCITATIMANEKLPTIIKSTALFLCLFIVIKSASRSGLVGILLLLAGFLPMAIFSGEKRRSPLKKIISMAVGLIFLSVIIYFAFHINLDAIDFILSRADSTDALEQADIRGYTRIIQFPEYLFFGAGQGLDLRFNAHGTEIHSTPAGILFYYGLSGFLLFLLALYQIFHRLNIYEKLFFLSPLMYSFSTFGFRTPIFWFYLGAFYFYSTTKQSRLYKITR